MVNDHFIRDTFKDKLVSIKGASHCGYHSAPYILTWWYFLVHMDAFSGSAIRHSIIRSAFEGHAFDGQ